MRRVLCGKPYKISSADVFTNFWQGPAALFFPTAAHGNIFELAMNTKRTCTASPITQAKAQ
jgi:hypothetical protein